MMQFRLVFLAAHVLQSMASKHVVAAYIPRILGTEMHLTDMFRGNSAVCSSKVAPWIFTDLPGMRLSSVLANLLAA